MAPKMADLRAGDLVISEGPPHAVDLIVDVSPGQIPGQLKLTILPLHQENATPRIWNVRTSLTLPDNLRVARRPGDGTRLTDMTLEEVSDEKAE